MRRLVAVGLLPLLIGGCGSDETAPELVVEHAACSAQCSSLEIVGSLVELAPASRLYLNSTRLAQTDGAWVVAWHSEVDKSAYLQRIDASGVPVGGAYRVQNAQGLAPHWDGTSLALWAQIYDQHTLTLDQVRTLSFARFDADLSLVESAPLVGPEGADAFIAFDFAGAHAFAYTTSRIALPIRQLRLLPGPVLEQNQHFLAEAEPNTRGASLAWTGKEIATTYLTRDGYHTAFLEPSTLQETTIVDVGPAGSEAPQDIQSVMGETLLWNAVWEMATARLSLSAIDVESHTLAVDPIVLPWNGTLTFLTVVGDAPLLVSRPIRHELGEPENDIVVPLDTATLQVCQGTRFGRANIIDLDLRGGEGAALLSLDDAELFFARVRCK